MRNLVICLLLLLSGCAFSPFGRSASPPPDLSDLEPIIERYDETRKQALYATEELVERAMEDLRPPPDPETGETDEPNVARAWSRLYVADNLLDDMIAVEGYPTHPVSMDPEDLGMLGDLVKEHGGEAREATDEASQRMQDWAAAQWEAAKRGKKGKFGDHIKFAVLAVLALIAVAGYVVLRISHGKTMASLFAVVVSVVLVIFVVYAYWAYIMIAAAVLIGLAVLTVLYLWVKGTIDFKQVISNVQSGRSAIPKQYRDMWDASTKEQMPDDLQVKVSRVKKASGIDEPGA